MRFVVYAKDKADAKARRRNALSAHRRHLDTAPARNSVQVLLSGPLLDGKEEMIGSFYLLEAPDRSKAQALIDSDPLLNEDVWGSLSIDIVMLRQDNMSNQGLQE